MERLTYWCDNGHGGGKWFVAIDAEGGEDYGPHVDRLAAYEEAGLEPEDFKRAFSEDTILKLAGQALGITPDRLRELAQADKEGISPCTFCRFNPPSSGDGKPCCMCPAEAALRREQDKKEEAQNDILRWCEFLSGGTECLFRSKKGWEYRA